MATENSTFYVYEPLKYPTSIRLLELLPGQQEDSLCCNIVAADIDENPIYEAISYVWGDANDRVSVLCNSTSLQIPRNLADGLRIFREEQRPRILWADSICIDQDNVLERNQQVCLMGRLYKDAQCVLIWLGQHNEDEIRSMSSCISDIWSTYKFISEEFGEFPDPHSPATKALLPKYLEVLEGCKAVDGRTYAQMIDIDPTSIEAIDKFLTNPWFARAWTFQERFLARRRRFYCGPVEIDWACTIIPHILYDLSTMGIGNLPPRTPINVGESFINTATFEEMSERKTEPEISFLAFQRLLSARAGSACKEPADLVYSLLSSTNDPIELKPDYQLPLVKIFSQAAVQIITCSKTLDLLRDVACHRDTSMPDWPSWIPDWRQKAQHITMFNQVGHNFYACSKTSTCVHSVSADGCKLSLRGFLIDKIATVEDNVTPAGRFSLLEKLAEPKPSPVLDDLRGDRDKRARMIRSLFCDVDLMNLPPTQITGSKDSLSRILTALEESFKSSETDASSKKQLRTVATWSSSMAAFVTDIKLSGMAPVDAQAGDLVIVLFGCNAPVVIRPTAQSDEYSFIGLCYLDKMMDGEAMDWIDPADDLYPDGDTPVSQVGTEAREYLPVRDFVLV